MTDPFNWFLIRQVRVVLRWPRTVEFDYAVAFDWKRRPGTSDLSPRRKRECREECNLRLTQTAGFRGVGLEQGWGQFLFSNLRNAPTKSYLIQTSTRRHK